MPAVKEGKQKGKKAMPMTSKNLRLRASRLRPLKRQNKPNFQNKSAKIRAIRGYILDNFGNVWDKKGAVLDNFGHVLDKFGAVMDTFGATFSPKNRVYAAKNTDFAKKTV